MICSLQRKPDQCGGGAYREQLSIAAKKMKIDRELENSAGGRRDRLKSRGIVEPLERAEQVHQTVKRSSNRLLFGCENDGTAEERLHLLFEKVAQRAATTSKGQNQHLV